MKVDIERVKNYKAIKLMTRIKEDLVLKTMPQFPSKMVMVGVPFRLRRNLKYGWEIDKFRLPHKIALSMRGEGP